VSKADSISQELAVLESRKKTIIGLYADRNVAVKLMSYFTTMAPNGVVLSDVSSGDKDGKLLVDGYSETTEDVGVFIAALSARADFFQKVELIDIKADKLASKSVFKFSVGMKVEQKLM
jgi:DNA-binding response OmpR family regulator